MVWEPASINMMPSAAICSKHYDLIIIYHFYVSDQRKPQGCISISRIALTTGQYLDIVLQLGQYQP